MNRRSFWTCAIFYFFIAFEFFYMAGPFAIYVYSIYGPGLSFVNESTLLAWLCSMFLPHIVIETSSFLVNLHNVVGIVLMVIGLSAFCISAGQVYYHKISQKGIVTRGIYNFIRHTQYSSLIICSFGLLLLWPRYIVLLSFIAMFFAYYFLAKVEEDECEDKYGESYREYRKRTCMFLPFHISFLDKLPSLPKSGLKRYLAIILFYVVTSAAAIGWATGLESWSLNSLYGLYFKDAAYISVIKVEENTLKQIVNIASANAEVQMRLATDSIEPGAKFINYVLPVELYVSEIPMKKDEGVEGHHFLPKNYSGSLFKIIFTKAETRTKQKVEGKAILLNTLKQVPVLEVRIDLIQNRIMEILNPSTEMNYENIPMPVY